MSRVWPAGAHAPAAVWSALVLGAYGALFVWPILGRSVVPLVSAAALFVAALALGRAVLRRGADGTGLDFGGAVAATGLGLLLISSVAMAAGALGLWTPAWAWGLAAGLGALGILWPARNLSAVAEGGTLQRPGLTPGPPTARWQAWWHAPRPGLDLIALGLASAALGIALASALAPPTAFDALVYHLTVPERWIAHGHMVDLPLNRYARLTLNLHLLFTQGMLMGGDRVPALIHWGCAVLAAAGVWAAGAKLNAPRAGLWAAATVCVMPRFVTLAGQPMVDLGVLACQAAACLAFLEWRAGAAARWLVAAGALAAGAGLVKYHGFGAVPALGLAALWIGWRRGGWRGASAAALAFAAGAALAALPWGIRAFLWRETGPSPMPLAAGYAGATEIHPTVGRFMGWLTLIRLPWDLTMDENRFGGGLIGPVWLMGVPLLLRPWRAWPGPARWLLLYAAVSLAGWAALPAHKQSLRLLLPAFPALALSGAMLAEGLSGWARRAAAALWLAGAALGVGYIWHRTEVHVAPFPVVFGAQTEESYLVRRAQDYALQREARDLPADAAVFFVGHYGTYYARRDVASRLATSRLERALCASRSSDGMARVLKAAGIGYLGTGGEPLVQALEAAGIPTPIVESFVRTRLEPAGRFLYRVKPS